jgi:hypothetical protein
MISNLPDEGSAAADSAMCGGSLKAFDEAVKRSRKPA